MLSYRLNIKIFKSVLFWEKEKERYLKSVNHTLYFVKYKKISFNRSSYTKIAKIAANAMTKIEEMNRAPEFGSWSSTSLPSLPAVVVIFAHGVLFRTNLNMASTRLAGVDSSQSSRTRTTHFWSLVMSLKKQKFRFVLWFYDGMMWPTCILSVRK